jgi:ankyrin repeat protein
MICELLTDGVIDATLPVIYEYREGTALHWACSNGYFDLVLLLLTYFKVDVCSKDTNGNEPIYYAAQNGHTESYSF